MTEYQLQKSVVQFLDLALPEDAVYFAVPNGEKRAVHTAQRLKAAGVKAGVPDLCIVYQGRAIFVELKTASGRPSKAQQAMEDALGRAGAGVWLCRTLDGLQTALRAEGVPLRAAA